MQISNSRYSHLLLSILLLSLLGLVNGLYNPALYKANPTAFWMADFIQYCFLPFIVLYLLYRKHGVVPGDYGLTASSKNYPAWEMMGAGIFAAFVLVMVWTVFWNLGFFLFGRDDFQFSYSLVIPDGSLRVPVILYLALTAGFVEEVVFRGLIWAAISKIGLGKFQKGVYLISSSLLFAAVHWEQGLASVVGAFGFGFVAAAFYLQLRNLWPMIAAHSLADIYFFW